MKNVKQKKVSIIVLNYYGEKFVKLLYDSLLKTKYGNFEIIVVDNNSKDNSVRMIKEVMKTTNKIKLIESKKNLGFSGGNNLGIAEADGDYVVLINNDIIAYPPEWLSNLVRVAESSRRIGVVGGSSIPMELKGVIALQDIQDRFSKPRLINRASGSMFLIKREVINRIGVLDEDYFLYREDTQYCFRAYLQGYDTMLANDAFYFNYTGGSTGIKKVNQRKEFKKVIKEKKVNALYYFYRNELMFYLTCYQFRNMIWNVPRPFLRAIYHLVIKGNPHVMISLIKGIKWLVGNKQLLSSRRKAIQATRTRGDWEFLRRERVMRQGWKVLNRFYRDLEKKVRITLI